MVSQSAQRIHEPSFPPHADAAHAKMPAGFRPRRGAARKTPRGGRVRRALPGPAAYGANGAGRQALRGTAGTAGAAPSPGRRRWLQCGMGLPYRAEANRFPIIGSLFVKKMKPS
ncbi:hypothetical protein HMPREF0731_1654 [Pseudoroseomonas cervicalis ATCC 49957]|uniref:Uncharacterized protein n=1 Tax=Pseudoroseomonas cervicalis ATCC 49957 TaxID=525371 RepID=D5RKP4_9PROT|nr:hypothetical protein HMPREF0731_1654 [Pseudoroseomonas cervicalis ATCC 49957]